MFSAEDINIFQGDGDNGCVQGIIECQIVISQVFVDAPQLKICTKIDIFLCEEESTLKAVAKTLHDGAVCRVSAIYSFASSRIYWCLGNWKTFFDCENMRRKAVEVKALIIMYLIIHQHKSNIIVQ